MEETWKNVFKITEEENSFDQHYSERIDTYTNVNNNNNRFKPFQLQILT